MLLLFSHVAALLMPQSGDSLTVEQALVRARFSRPRIVAAGAAVERARGAARAGATIPNPSAQLETDDLAPTHKATVVQQLSWMPRLGADRAAGRAGIDRARADSAQTIAGVARDVVLAFYTALAADLQFALSEEQRALSDSLDDFAGRRAQAGDISELERDQIAQEAARARLASAQAREETRVARVQLARSVAWDRPLPPVAAGPLDAGLDAAPTTLSTSDVNELPAMRGAVADSTAAAERLRAARLARIPIPGILAGREWGGTGATRNVILGLAVPIPLWNWGGQVVEQARGSAREQAAFAAETRLALRADFESAVARVEERTLRAHFARDSLLPQARRVRAGAVRLYEEGRTSVVPVLDALRIERDVARTAVAELLGFQQARADLAAMLGRWP